MAESGAGAPPIAGIRPRIIPILQVSGRDLVKTQRFANPQYLGDPLNAVRIFNDSDADELILIDIDASRQNRGPNLSFLEAVASVAQMPLAYGGGISTSLEAEQVVRLGFEKITVQALVWKHPKIVREIALALGSQALVVSIDCSRTSSGWQSTAPIGEGSETKLALDEALTGAVALEAGELLITSINQEGTLGGPNFELAKTARNIIEIPLIYNGGVSNEEDWLALHRIGIDAIGVGARFLFRDHSRALMIQYPDQTKLRKLFGTKI